MRSASDITIQDLGELPTVAAAARALSEMSLAGTEHELFASFTRQFKDTSSVTHLLNLAVEGCEPGSFRVMLRQDLRDDSITPARLRDELSRYHMPLEATKVEQSAVLSRLVQGPSAKLARSVDPAEDELLAAWVDQTSDLLAIPIFMNGVVNEFAVMCQRPDPAPMDEHRLSAGIGSVNLMARCYETLAIKNEIERLHTRLDAQVHEIGRIQRSLLPSVWPRDSRVDVATSYEPSEAAGGDYFDYRTFPGPDGHDDLLGIVIADVSGHGPVAAVTMAVFRTAMRATVQYTTKPESTVPDVNSMIYESVEPGTFVTAFLVAFDPSTGAATCRCCGHNPPRVRRRSGAIDCIDGEGGPPLGILPDITVPQQRLTLAPGDTLVLYTDGITEAFSPEGELFGTERLDAAIASASSDPDDMKRAILDAVDRHADGRPRDDDQTLVIVRYNGPEPGAP
ncbi:MAG: PP2C family protein-serine/threonine phosphatase [Planctomycetota bacterium]